MGFIGLVRFAQGDADGDGNCVWGFVRSMRYCVGLGFLRGPCGAVEFRIYGVLDDLGGF
jgi:hypothetical protein